jgi:hypothetical protein
MTDENCEMISGRLLSDHVKALIIFTQLPTKGCCPGIARG